MITTLFYECRSRQLLSPLEVALLDATPRARPDLVDARFCADDILMLPREETSRAGRAPDADGTPCEDYRVNFR